MKYKLYTQKTKIKDKLYLDGYILTINDSINIDLESPSEYKYPVNDDILVEQERFYIKDGLVYGLIYTDSDTYNMFINNNAYRYYDVDMSGDISIDELKILVDHYNMSNEERAEAQKKIYEDYLKIPGNTKETWKKKGTK